MTQKYIYTFSRFVLISKIQRAVLELVLHTNIGLVYFIAKTLFYITAKPLLCNLLSSLYYISLAAKPLLYITAKPLLYITAC